MSIKALAAIAAITLATGVPVPSAAQAQGASALVAIQNEPAPKVTVDAPFPEPLARGVAVIAYRLENFRILPVLGAAALGVSPRVGHLHVKLNDSPWHWGDFGNSSTIVVGGLPPGQHRVQVELADSTHRVLAKETVSFTVPATASHAH
jgi:hypothetical protein